MLLERVYIKILIESSELRNHPVSSVDLLVVRQLPFR